MERKIIFPDMEEIIEINRSLGCRILERGKLDFIFEKIKSKIKRRDIKRDIAHRAAILWYDIIMQHPFLDGNKRTATEAVKLFLNLNGFKLKLNYNAIIYISLKIANQDITQKELERIIYKNLEKV